MKPSLFKAILFFAFIMFSFLRLEKTGDQYEFVRAQSGLVIRQSPGTSSKKIGLLGYGAKVLILETQKEIDTINGIKGNWKKISFPSGTYGDPPLTGYVFGGYLSAAESDHKLSGYKKIKAENRKLKVKNIATMEDRDYYLPRISPANDKVVFASVLKEKDATFSSKIFYYDLKEHRKKLIIDRKNSKASSDLSKGYFFLPSDITWKNNNLVNIIFSNGDFGIITLVYDIKLGKIIVESRGQGGDGIVMDKTGKTIFEKVQKTYPFYDAGNLYQIASGIQYINYEPQKITKIFYQVRDVNFSSDVNVTDFTAGGLRDILNGNHLRLFLVGSVQYKDKYLLEITNEKNNYIFEYGKNLKLLDVRPVNEEAYPVKLIYKTGKNIIFMNRLYKSYEQGNNPLFIYDGITLNHINNWDNLNELNYSRDFSKLAVCYWKNNKRVISIYEIKENL